MFDGKETAVRGLALCFACGDPVESGKRKMRCDLCQGQIVTLNAVYDLYEREVDDDGA